MRHFLSGLLLVVACGNPAATASPEVTVTMVERTTGGPARTLVTVNNETHAPIHVGGCGIFIQALRAGAWHVAYSPSCVLASSTIEPGSSHTRELSFLSSDAPFPAPAYRAAVGFQFSAEGEEFYAYSAPFEP